MNLVFTSYSSSPEYSQPELWLGRIRGYAGILEHLNRTNKVTGIERINYQGVYEYNGVQYLFIQVKRKVIRFPFRMHRQIRKLQPDVVFVNGFIFPLQIMQLKWQLGRDVKIVILHRAEKPFTGIKKYLQKFADSCVSHYLFASSEFGDAWIQGGIIRNRTKIREIIQGSSVFYPGDKDRARQILSVSGSPVFLWVGRLDANKDPLTIINAFIKILAIQPAARLYMIYAADDLLQTVKELIATSPTAVAAIKLVGSVDHTQMQHWYNCADFIVSGSHYEGSGIAVSEAMSCGCIPIVTDIISFRRMTGPGKCGFLFKRGDPQDLYETLLQATKIDLPSEREKVLNQFKDELSFEAIAGKINQLIASFKPGKP